MQRLEKKHISMLGNKKASKVSAGEFRCGDAIHGQWRPLDVGSAVAGGNGSQVSNENQRGKLPPNRLAADLHRSFGVFFGREIPFISVKIQVGEIFFVWTDWVIYMTLDLHVLSVLLSLSCLYIMTDFILFVDHTLGFFEEVCRYASHGIHEASQFSCHFL